MIFLGSNSFYLLLVNYNQLVISKNKLNTMLSQARL